MRALLVGLTLLAVPLYLPGSAVAQITLCTGTGFAAAPGVTACNGASKPATVTATVKTYARLSLEEVFGTQAASLQFAMGDVDASCVAPPAAGVTCASDASRSAATWYGSIKFRVKLAGVGATRGKITGLRPSSGTIPDGRLLDGEAGAVPTTVYPVAPGSPADLKTGIGTGDTVVSRSLGLRVNSADPAGAWTGNTVFSLVLE